MNYYNEIDPKAAAWLRELIKAGLIPQGDVDERDIRDIRPDELAGYTQCHFFAGIGGWSRALELAGWPADRPVWTGSCPCQPFSAAGRGAGVADERHLWPHWFHLISQCQPAIVFGEQVASKDGLGWLDLVCSDMEGAGYAIGAADMCAAGFGAPHIRQRLWFVGERLEHAAGDGREQRRAEPSGRGIASGCGLGDVEHASGDGSQGWIHGRTHPGREAVNGSSGRDGAVVGLAGWERVQFAAECDPDGDGWCSVRNIDPAECDCIGPTEDAVEYKEHDGTLYGRRLADANQTGRGRQRADHDGSTEVVVGPPAGWGAHGARCGEAGGLADAYGGNASAERQQRERVQRLQPEDGSVRVGPDAQAGSGRFAADSGRPSPTDGFWRDADWLFCRDGKWRPVEPSTFPLAHGLPARVGRLRGYGNAISPIVGAAFIEAALISLA